MSRRRLVDLVERPSEPRFLLLGVVLWLVLHGGFTALALRFGWTHLRIDEAYVAARLYAGLGYTFNYYGLFDEGFTEGAFFPPGYVWNVWLLLKLFGTPVAILLQNALFTLGIALVLYAFAKRLFGDRSARVALLAALLYPPFFSRIGHGSPVYFKMFFMLLALMALQRLWVRRKGALLAGASLGFLALSMPDVLALVALFAAAYLWRERFRWPALLEVTLLCLATAALIAPWTIRNWVKFGEVTLVSTNGGFNFYMGHNPRTRGEVDYSVVQELDQRLGGELARADEFERDGILYREGLRYIREHPLRSLGNMLERAARHWSFRPHNVRALAALGDTREFTATFQLYIWSYAASYAALIVLALLGAVRLRPRWQELAPLLLLCVYSTAIAALFVVQTKMRLIKVEPVLVLLAASWLAGAGVGSRKHATAVEKEADEHSGGHALARTRKISAGEALDH